MQLTVRDVSRFLDVSESTVTRWIKQRGLPAQHVGGQYRFNRVELLEWATANQIKVSVEVFDHLEAEDEPGPSLAEALEAGGIFYGLQDTNKERALRALVEVLPLPEGVDRELLLRLFLAREASATHGDRRRHRLAARAQPDRAARRAPDGHALLPGAAGRLRGARWQTGARPVFAHLPDDAEPPADALAALLRPARREASRAS